MMPLARTAKRNVRFAHAGVRCIASRRCFDIGACRLRHAAEAAARSPTTMPTPAVLTADPPAPGQGGRDCRGRCHCPAS